MTTSSTVAAPTITCPAWCTSHCNDSDLDYHSTAYLRVADADINMCTGTLSGDVRIFGLHSLGVKGEDRGESISLQEAEQVAWLLLGMVASAKRDQEGV
jgi:hypothetical protein